MAGKTISNLSVVLNGNVAPYAASMRSATSITQGFVSSTGSAAGSLLKLTGIGAAIGAAWGALKGMAGGIGLASSLEQTQVAFETLLGSADGATTMMKELKSFAASTPFEFPELATAARSLVAFGVAADQVQPSLRAIGDISAGVGAPIGDIAELFGKARVQGTLYAEDINQLVGRGIPVIQEFAKQLGVSEGEVKKMASKGQISFANLQTAFRDLTADGGKFGGMMAKQSQTLGGLWSTLSDTVSMTTADIAADLLAAFNVKGGIASITSGITFVGGWLTSTVRAWAPVIVGVVKSIYTGVTSTFSAIASWLSPVVTSIGNFIAANWQRTVQTTTSYLTAIWGVVKGVFTVAWQIVSAVGNAIAYVWGGSMRAISAATGTASANVGGAFQLMFDVGQWFVSSITAVLVGVGFVLQNWADIGKLACMEIGLAMVRTGNQIGYVLGTVVPAYLVWFGSNFANIMANVGSYTATVFTNMAKNVGNFFSGVASLLTGGGFNFEWTSLTEGFQSTMAALPKIAEREMGPLEARTQAAVDAMHAKLGAGLSDYLGDQQKTTKGITDGLNNLIPDIKSPEIDAPVMPVAEMKIDVPTSPLDAAADKAKEVKATIDSLKASVSGSAEAMQASAQAAYQSRLGTATTVAAPTPAATPVAAPLPAAATKPMQEQAAANSLLAEVVAILTTGNGYLSTIAKGKTTTSTEVVPVTF